MFYGIVPVLDIFGKGYPYLSFYIPNQDSPLPLGLRLPVSTLLSVNSKKSPRVFNCLWLLDPLEPKK